MLVRIFVENIKNLKMLKSDLFILEQESERDLNSVLDNIYNLNVEGKISNEKV